jgi:hypothetical protein
MLFYKHGLLDHNVARECIIKHTSLIRAKIVNRESFCARFGVFSFNEHNNKHVAVAAIIPCAHSQYSLSA